MPVLREKHATHGFSFWEAMSKDAKLGVGYLFKTCESMQVGRGTGALCHMLWLSARCQAPHR